MGDLGQRLRLLTHWRQLASNTVRMVRPADRPAPLRVSVVIPTYNRANSLPATLDGLLQQTYAEFEVIVVAGPCTDATFRVLSHYPSLRVVSCAEARVGLARNIGVDAAAGEVIAFIDDDAVPRNTWLAQLVACYADPAIGAAGGFVWDAVEDRMQWRICTCSREGHARTDAPPPPDVYQGRRADPFLYLSGCNMSVRRDLLVQCGGFDDTLSSIYEDVDVCRWIIDAGLRIAVRPDALVDHSYGPNEVRDANGTVRDPYRIVHSYAVYIGHNPPPRAGRAEVERLVRAYAENWRGYGRSQAESSVISAGQLAHFMLRVDCAVRQGLHDGAKPRPHWSVAPPDPGAFRTYRDMASPTPWRRPADDSKVSPARQTHVPPQCCKTAPNGTDTKQPNC